MLFHQEAVVWVYLDLAKEAISQKKQEEAAEHIDTILLLPFYSNQLLCQQVYWLIVRFVWHTTSSLPKSQVMLARLLHFPCPEDPKLCDALLNTALKVQTDWASLLPFLLWAKLENVQKSAEIERFIKPIAHVLLTEKDGYGGFSYQFYAFFDWLEGIHFKFPELVFAPYYLAKIYMLVGDHEKALVVAKKLVQNKKNDFWTWQLLALCVVDNNALRLALLAKAMSLGGKEEMLLGLRQELANCLILNDNWEAAKHEILCSIAVRNRNNWKISATIWAWQQQETYQKIDAKKLDYISYLPTAEGFVFQENPKIQIVITKVEPITHMAYYVDAMGNGGKTCFKKLGIKSITVADCFEATTMQHPAKDYWQVVSLLKTNAFEWVKKFKATVCINAAGVGFADNVYIAPKMVAETKLRTNNSVEGIAIEAFDAKKNKKGWKAIIILSN